jgi:hypothetical protein
MMKTLILSERSGREVHKNQWLTKKNYKGREIRFEVLELYAEDETARVKIITNQDGYLYTTETFHKLGLKRVML